MAMTEEAEEVEEKAPLEPQNFSIGIHAWIETAQTSHGVRHEDFGQYHGYCTRRLARLRHNPDVKKDLLHSSKYAKSNAKSNTHTSTSTVSHKGRPRHAYCARDDTAAMQVVPHSHFLWVMLVSAERAWAQASEIKKGGSRQHAIRRLHKAQQLATRLEASAKINCDAVTYKECQAYTGWMKGNWALEKGHYKTASLEFAKAMTLCHELAQESSGDENDPEKLERKDLFATRAEIVLRPLFRYCQYELKEAGEEAVEEPVFSASTSAPSSSPQDSVIFRGQELAIYNKDLRVLLLKLQSLKGTQEITFIQSLSTLDDALAIIQSSFAALEGSKAGPAVNAKKQRLDLWKGYLTYEKTMRVMGHTSKLLETIEGHAERVHVYDALLQHNRTLLQLPRPEDSDEDEFSLQTQANSLRLRALKCYHMAMHYFQQRKQYAHSVALVQQSQTLAKRALEEIAACDDDMPYHTEYMEELEELETKLQGATAGMQAALFLSTSSLHVQKSNRPLLLRLDEADAGSVLADVPPAIMPMPCKPIFYDLAYDVAVDSTESTDAIQKYIEDHSVQPKSSSVGGLLGWFSSSK